MDLLRNILGQWSMCVNWKVVDSREYSFCTYSACVIHNSRLVSINVMVPTHPQSQAHILPYELPPDPCYSRGSLWWPLTYQDNLVFWFPFYCYNKTPAPNPCEKQLKGERVYFASRFKIQATYHSCEVSSIHMWEAEKNGWTLVFSSLFPFYMVQDTGSRD